MPKIPCKKNLSCSQKRKQLEALKQVHGSCQILVLRVCMYIYIYIYIYIHVGPIFDIYIHTL
jgi:hypothetical protein